VSRSACLGALAAIAACGTDPVSSSAPVTLELKAESGAPNGAVTSEQKDITSEPGNPYGAFIADARTELGRDPGRVEIDTVTLALDARSMGVSTLDQVYAGDVDVLFLLRDTNDTYDVARIADPAGIGPMGLRVMLGSDELADPDWPRFLDGKFKVIVRGTAAPPFATRGATAILHLTFTFAAFE